MAKLFAVEEVILDSYGHTIFEECEWVLVLLCVAAWLVVGWENKWSIAK